LHQDDYNADYTTISTISVVLQILRNFVATCGVGLTEFFFRKTLLWHPI